MLLVYELTNTLVGYPHVGSLKSMSILWLFMTKNLLKPTNILFNLKEHDKDDVMTIRQVYSARYAYNKSYRGGKTEMK